MKLIILGNGFDLHHGLKTSFADFRKHLMSSGRSSDKLLAERIDLILKSRKNIQANTILWNDYENIMGQNFAGGINIKNEEFLFFDVANEFSERFYQYLVDINREKKIAVNGNIQSELKDADCVLTFNYTDSYLTYLNPEHNVPVFHIHGTLEDNNLPIIGFYYNNSPQTNSLDYLIRYQGKGFHKPALALKQNEIDLDRRILEFKQKWKNQFSEIVSIGYSFGKSDSHIFSILDDTMLKQIKEKRLPKSRVTEIPIINFKLFNYNQHETDSFNGRITTELQNRHKRSSTVMVYGDGHKEKEKELIKFSQVKY